MKRIQVIIAVLGLTGSLWQPAGSAALVAGTLEERAVRLGQAIDGASEQGNYNRVQTLRLQLARLYASAQRFSDAARQYELLLASRPARYQRVRYFIQLGNMRSASQDYSGAISAYQDAVHDNPKSWEANFDLARVYARVDLNENAMKSYQKCLALKPSNVDAYVRIASVYQRMGYLDKALSFYKKSLALSPRPDAYLGMADCYALEDNTAEATQILQKAKTLLPAVDYDIRLGEIYRRQGDLDRARQAWVEVLKNDPARDEVRLNLALVDDQLHRDQEADRLIRPLLTAYPQSPLVHFCDAWILFDRGDRSDAKKECLKVQQLSPTDVVRHYNESLLALLEKRR